MARNYCPLLFLCIYIAYLNLYLMAPCVESATGEFEKFVPRYDLKMTPVYLNTKALFEVLCAHHCKRLWDCFAYIYNNVSNDCFMYSYTTNSFMVSYAAENETISPVDPFDDFNISTDTTIDNYIRVTTAHEPYDFTNIYNSPDDAYIRNCPSNSFISDITVHTPTFIDADFIKDDIGIHYVEFICKDYYGVQQNIMSAGTGPTAGETIETINCPNNDMNSWTTKQCTSGPDYFGITIIKIKCQSNETVVYASSGSNFPTGGICFGDVFKKCPGGMFFCSAVARDVTFDTFISDNKGIKKLYFKCCLPVVL